MNATNQNTKSLTAVNPQLNRPWTWAIEFTSPLGRRRLMMEHGLFPSHEAAQRFAERLNWEEYAKIAPYSAKEVSHD
jgi:hypothetical protein